MTRQKTPQRHPKFPTARENGARMACASPGGWDSKEITLVRGNMANQFLFLRADTWDRYRTAEFLATQGTNLDVGVQKQARRFLNSLAV
jgi:hypothetical protein